MSEPGSGAAPLARPPVARGGRGRTVAAVALIVLGALLVPASITAGYARQMLGNSDAFVAALAPVIEDPAVQQFAASEVAETINDSLNIEGVVNDIIGGLDEAVANERASAALNALRVPVADGIRSGIEEATWKVFTSQRFQQAWTNSLQRSHEVAVRVLESDSNSVVAVVDGGLGLQLGPLVEQARSALVARGFDLAARIPDTDKTILLVPSAALPQAQTVYQVVMAAGYWLALVGLVLTVAGIALARSRPRAAFAAALAWAIGTLLVMIAVRVGERATLNSVPESVVPDSALSVLYRAVTSPLLEIAGAILLFSLAVASAAWLALPNRVSRAVRDGWEGFRGRQHTRWLRTGRLGRWLHQRRATLRILVATAVVAVLLVNRPLTVEVVAWTMGLGALVLVGFSLLRSPPEELD